MGRPSSVDKLPDEIQSEIGRLRMQGCTIDQIVAHLRTLYGGAPSRSALGRHLKGMEGMRERLLRSRQVAEVLVRELGDAPESQAARLNIELLHTAIMDLFMRHADHEEVNAHGAAALAGDPEGTMMLAKALDHLGRASKSNIDFIKAAEDRAEARAKTAAAKAVEAVAKDRGLTKDTVEAIKSNIFGVKA